jgi:lipopolysaccharide/colanic/teichoic acid biosynthesis glycosyltransferase
MTRLRQLFDLACAVVGLVVLSPLFAVIAAAIKLQDGGPIFYSQWRVGKNFRPFRLYKFRSMIPGADRAGRLLTEPGDRRLTRLGKFLRRYKLDELPQLINVLKGEMQLVGSRPEVERYVKAFPSEYALLLRERPGITDPSTLAFRHEERMFGTANVEREYIAYILPAKLKICLEYARRRNFGSDLVVILRTLFGSKLFRARTRIGPAQRSVPSSNLRT